MKVLRCIPALCLLLLPGMLRAGSPFFCDRAGTVLDYERNYADDGRLKWHHCMTIGEVSGPEGGLRSVDYVSCFTKPSGAVMYGGPVRLCAELLPSGDVKADLSASLASVFRNIFPGRAVSSEPCPSVLPSDMLPGDVLPDASFCVTVAFARYNVTVSDRKVLRRETLSTPAGDFDCIVVSEHKEERGPGRNRVTTALTWYARGIGMVRHDTYGSDLGLETSEILTSVKFPDTL